MDAPKIGCNGIQKAMGMDFLEVINVYLNDIDDATKPVMVFTAKGDDSVPVMTLNYCPFCGTRFKGEMPTCADKIGRERRQVRDVVP